MSIDAIEDPEVVETQVENDSETGNQVDGAMVDVDPDATDAEIAGANLICGGDDIPWEGGEDGETSTDGGGEPDGTSPAGDTSMEPNQRTFWSPSKPEEGNGQKTTSEPVYTENPKAQLDNLKVVARNNDLLNEYLKCQNNRQRS